MLMIIIIIIIKFYNYEIIITTDQSGQSVYSFSEQIGPKPYPVGPAHTHIAFIREYPPG